MLYFDGSPITLSGDTSRTFSPRWLCPDNPFIRRHRPCAEFKSLWQFCLDRKPRAIALYRTYALGDILMLLPLARMMHRVLKPPQPIRVIVEGRYLTALTRLQDPRIVLMRAHGMTNYGADVHLDLNGALEADHRGGQESDHHRMMLYAKALGLPLANLRGAG